VVILESGAVFAEAAVGETEWKVCDKNRMKNPEVKNDTIYFEKVDMIL
jgi:hypothetical protein